MDLGVTGLSRSLMLVNLALLNSLGYWSSNLLVSGVLYTLKIISDSKEHLVMWVLYVDIYHTSYYSGHFKDINSCKNNINVPYAIINNSFYGK